MTKADTYQNQSEGPYRALRFNTLKVRPDTRKYLIERWGLEKVPWCKDGYYYPESLRPGLSPYHAAGVYYIQEPSAMMPTELLSLPEGALALDLCAAPGGKATRLMEKAAIVLANDPIYKRARILSSNIERMGFVNSIVTCAYPEALSLAFPEFFDFILVDAPCSGEAMKRKNNSIELKKNRENILSFVKRQSQILEGAYRMLSPGGSIVYSTCTFEEAENEGMLSLFTLKHPDLRLIKTLSLSPLKIRGEGQFAGVVKKEGKRIKKKISIDKICDLMSRESIHILRKGLLMKDEEPSHAGTLAASFESDDSNKINILDESLALKYLRGETLSPRPGDNLKQGWLRVYFDGYPLGNARLSGNIIKNHYPKGLRFH